MTKAYIILDEETTIKNKTIGNNKAFPFYDDNKIVLHGIKLVSKEYPTGYIYQVRNPTFGDAPSDGMDKDVALIVGHNVKFDLHYLMKWDAYTVGIPIRDWLVKNNIWDTQQAEYILSGQSKLFPSLDYCSSKYGGELKDDKIKEMWDNDIQTEDIDEELLAEYHEGDLNNTDIVFKAQLKEAKDTGMLPLIRAMNTALQGYQEMEFNGMHVDLTDCEAYGNQERRTLRGTETELRSFLPDDIKEHVNFNSPIQLSALLFAGEIKYKIKERIGVYKTGKRAGEEKFTTVEKSIIKPLYKLKPSMEWRTKKKGIWKTSDEVFEALRSDGTVSPKAKDFILLLQQFRKLSKEINTYYTPIPGLVCSDGLIHQNINATQTATSRLSQNNPNLQNVSTGKTSNVKKMFTSRWGINGVILDADYKQLEVIALAYLSGDKQLKTDIKDGIDMHERTHNKVRHLLDPAKSDKEQRRQVKAVNFGLIYGGGANTLSKQSGLPVDVVKKIIKTFYLTYPGVLVWQNELLSHVESHKHSGYGHTKGGYPRSMGKMHSITGRQYTFLEYDAPDWVKATKHIDTSFSPTQIKNYPVQGFATGDIVPLVIGALYRRLVGATYYKDSCLMINTVHDSIIFDIRIEVLDDAISIIKEVMESAPLLLKDVFDIDFDLPLDVDITYGPNWKDQKW